MSPDSRRRRVDVSTYQGVDALVGQVVLRRGVVLHQLPVLLVVALADLVDLQTTNVTNLRDAQSHGSIWSHPLPFC